MKAPGDSVSNLEGREYSRRTTCHKEHTSGLTLSLLISLGGGTVHLPEHDVDDHVAEKEGHVAGEPLDPRKLVPGVSSCD